MFVDTIELLIVTEDVPLSNMLKQYFTAQGHRVVLADRSRAVQVDKLKLPDVVLLESPVVDDYWGWKSQRVRDVFWHQLRMTPYTSHIPVIFMIPMRNIRIDDTDHISDLELDKDDCIYIPLDVEELILRVQNAVTSK